MNEVTSPNQTIENQTIGIQLIREARVYVAGAETLIGGAILRALARQGYCNPVGGELPAPDLTCAREVDAFVAACRPQIVFLAAGKMGGIGANRRYPADLMLDNLRVTCNLIESAHRHGVTRLLYLASSCAYPKACPQPMREESLHTGALEPTSAAYAMAKLSGITLCEAFRSQHGADFFAGVPANVYGPGDHFDAENAHVIGALMARLHAAKGEGSPCVEVWGSGNAQREFLYVDDLADACVFVMRHYGGEGPINLGGGTIASIRELACMIRDVVGYEGELRFDATQPDGFALKALDSTRLTELGWAGATPLRQGLERTYRWFLQHHSNLCSEQETHS
jgi:GDP-L-fucose synthase